MTPSPGHCAAISHWDFRLGEQCTALSLTLVQSHTKAKVTNSIHFRVTVESASQGTLRRQSRLLNQGQWTDPLIQTISEPVNKQTRLVSRQQHKANLSYHKLGISKLCTDRELYYILDQNLTFTIPK